MRQDGSCGLPQPVTSVTGFAMTSFDGLLLCLHLVWGTAAAVPPLEPSLRGRRAGDEMTLRVVKCLRA